MSEIKAVYTCVSCGDPCKQAPTKKGWMSLNGLKAIHFDCLEHLWNVFEAMERREPTTSEERLKSANEENTRLQSALDEARNDAERKQAVLEGCGFAIEVDPDYGLYLHRKGTIESNLTPDVNIYHSNGVVYIPEPRVLPDCPITLHRKLTGKDIVDSVVSAGREDFTAGLSAKAVPFMVKDEEGETGKEGEG